MPGTESWLRRHAAWLCVAVAYLVVFPYFEKLNNPNENVRVWMTRAIVAHGTLAIDPVVREWGDVSDRAEFGGRRFSGKAPGTSLLGVPVLAVQRLVTGGEPSKRATIWALRVFSVALPLALFFLFFARKVEQQTGSPWARDLLVVGLGLGTMLYPYGLLFVGHAQSAALAFAGFLCLRDRRLVLAGLLTGLAVVFEYQALIAAGVIALYAVVEHRRRALLFFLGALGPALVLAAYHTAIFGRPWETPLSHVDDPIFKLYHGQGFLGFDRPRPVVLVQALFSLDYGIFTFSPLLLAGLGAAGFGLKTARRECLAILGVTVGLLLFLAGMTNWRGGWCAGGPRYVAPLVPFLVWALALGWQRLTSLRFSCAVLGALAAVSVIRCGLAGAHFPHYPVQFDNPLVDVTVRLVSEGYVPRGFWFALASIALAAGLALGVGRRTIRGVAASAGIAVALLAVLSLPGSGLRYDEKHALTVVRDAWGTHGSP